MTIRKTEYYHSNRHRMSTQKRATIFVEGPADEVLWRRFFSCIHCKLERVGGKLKVKSRLKSRQERKVSGFAGIIDADYWLITESDKLCQKDLLYDECYPDAELIILNSATLTDVLNKEFGLDDDPDIQKLAEVVTTEAERLAMEFGYFRLLNDCKSFGINFKDFWKSRRYAYDEFVDAEDIDSIQIRRDRFAMRLTEFHNAGKNRVIDKRIEHEELLAGVAKLKAIDKYQTPNIQLCQGHDTVALIAYLMPIMFKSVFGQSLPSRFKELCDRLKLERKLRNKYKEEYFIKTSLRENIKNWECANEPYRILRAEI